MDFYRLLLRSWFEKLIIGSKPTEELKTKTVAPFQFGSSQPRKGIPTDFETFKKSIQEFEASK